MNKCRHLRDELDWVRRQMAADDSEVPERLLRQIHFEIAAGWRRAQQVAALHNGSRSRDHEARLAMWEGLAEECEDLRGMATTARPKS